jgi:hypothetical protein
MVYADAMRARRLVAPMVSALAALAAASPAAAQVTAPPQAPIVQPAPSTRDVRLPIAVFDARVAFAPLGRDALTATGLGVTTDALPVTGVGGVIGAHVYPLRTRNFALGVGGEAMLVRAAHDLTDADGKPTGDRIRRRLRAMSGQVSFNFGHADGWSYLTAGMGPTAFDSYLDGATPDGLTPASLNFGGGARWFNFEHLAFALDLRFYTTKPALATTNTAARARKNVVVISGGISIK